MGLSSHSSRPQICCGGVVGIDGSRRGGFTFIEAMTAVTIATMVGVAVLTGVNASLQNTTAALDQTIGMGMAATLMDEIAGQGYARNPASPYDSPLAPNTAELARPGPIAIHEPGRLQQPQRIAAARSLGHPARQRRRPRWHAQSGHADRNLFRQLATNGHRFTTSARRIFRPNCRPGKRATIEPSKSMCRCKTKPESCIPSPACGGCLPMCRVRDPHDASASDASAAA